VELFKLHYFDSIFDLNVKGDSAELLSTVLKYIHGCYIDKNERYKVMAAAAGGQPLGGATSSGTPNTDDLDISCSERCIVHEQFYLRVTVRVHCKCKFIKELQNYYINNFAHVINGSEFLEDLAAPDPG
jgi:hypothetical protein